MADATIIGGGAAARACSEVMTRAGFRLRRAFELDDSDRSPVVLGDVRGAAAVAREAVRAGRHMLICSPRSLGAERLQRLLEQRRPSQALFVWSDRCYHPGYRFIRGLIRAEATWRPTYLRLETLSAEPTTSALARWRTLESLRLLMTIADDPPLSASATQADNLTRAGPDLISLLVGFNDFEAFVQLGLGEAIERREMLLAGPDRRVFVNELDEATPVRLVDYTATPRPGDGAGWLACGTPDTEDSATLQCLSFLDATLDPSRAREEATAWWRSLATLAGMERSFEANGAAVRVNVADEAPRLRLVASHTASLAWPPPSVA